MGPLRCWIPIVMAGTLAGAAEPSTYFKISVVDDATGRGVPLVELKTTSEACYYTDSNGIVAFYEPGLMDQRVYFHVRSHGYELPADGFGYSGKALQVSAGASAVIKIKRINIAERLYRITGEGIYRDTMVLGLSPPIRRPALNAQVTGLDGGVATPYRGKIYWFWGDTNKLSYPLGHFGTSGATSELPGKGGLDPSVGVDLEYFVDKSGFAKVMCPSSAIPAPGVKWVGSLTTVRWQDRERLIARYEAVKDLGHVNERGIAIFNDETQSFDRLAVIPLDAPLYLDGHPASAAVDGAAYLYLSHFEMPPGMRVRAELQQIRDPRAYEGYSCLAHGARYEKAATRLDRGSDGRLRYGWKRDTPPLNQDQQDELIAAGRLKPDEAWFRLIDFETGALVKPHAGSVQWNAFRKRWIMIVEENGSLGEIWFAEADSPVGPWVYARKIVTHNKYTFYNPIQHAFFDQDGGRIIYFEGTYSNFFSGSPEKTPRYDYNQMMYRLTLDDPRLALPAPVYRLRDSGTISYAMRSGIESRQAWNEIAEIPFFAVPPERRREGLVPIPPDKPIFYALPGTRDAIAGTWRLTVRDRDGSDYGFTLEVTRRGAAISARFGDEDWLVTEARFRAEKLELRVKFENEEYSLTAAVKGEKLSGEWKQRGGEGGTWTGERQNPREEVSPDLVPLYEHRGPGGTIGYSTQPAARPAEPIGRVWRNPLRSLVLDVRAKPESLP